MKMTSAHPIVLKNLGKSFKAPVLSDLKVSIQAGEAVSIVGANGAGKSTLIKIILGLVQPSTGSVEVFGAEPGTKEVFAKIGYLPELPGYWGELSAQELLRAVGKVRKLPASQASKRSEQLLEMLGLKRRGSRNMGGYSKGMLQRTGVAQMLLHDPDLLILDEPMSGLDPRAQEKLRVVLKRLNEKGKTLLVSSHSLEDIRSLCTRVIVLEKTKVVEDGPVDDVLDKLVDKYRSSEPWDEDPLGEVPDELL